jgi:hypothetical protein
MRTWVRHKLDEPDATGLQVCERCNVELFSNRPGVALKSDVFGDGESIFEAETADPVLKAAAIECRSIWN